jgi:hypothetical protein
MMTPGLMVWLRQIQLTPEGADYNTLPGQDNRGSPFANID